MLRAIEAATPGLSWALEAAAWWLTGLATLLAPACGWPGR